MNYIGDTTVRIVYTACEISELYTDSESNSDGIGKIDTDILALPHNYTTIVSGKYLSTDSITYVYGDIDTDAYYIAEDMVTAPGEVSK